MNELTEPGALHLGCNYWASHAGTRMWSDWRLDASLHGAARAEGRETHLDLPPCDGAVLRVRTTGSER